MPSSFFFFNDTATTEIYTLSLHDALPIWLHHVLASAGRDASKRPAWVAEPSPVGAASEKQGASWPFGGAWVERTRSEEHTSELQSRSDLVCRLLLEKKKKKMRRMS